MRIEEGLSCYFFMKDKTINDLVIFINSSLIQLYEVKPFVYKFSELQEIIPLFNIFGKYKDMPYRITFNFNLFLDGNDVCKIDICYEQKLFEEL